MGYNIPESRVSQWRHSRGGSVSYHVTYPMVHLATSSIAANRQTSVKTLPYQASFARGKNKAVRKDIRELPSRTSIVLCLP